MSKIKCAFRVGDLVEPKPAWVGSANRIPSGRVMAVEPWGTEGCLRVGDVDRRFWAASVFVLGKPAIPEGLLI